MASYTARKLTVTALNGDTYTVDPTYATVRQDVLFTINVSDWTYSSSLNGGAYYVELQNQYLKDNTIYTLDVESGLDALTDDVEYYTETVVPNEGDPYRQLVFITNSLPTGQVRFLANFITPDENSRVPLVFAQTPAEIREEIGAAKSSNIAKVISGETAEYPLLKGTYVIWNDELHITKENIAAGDTYSTSNLYRIGSGGLGYEVARLTNELINVSTNNAEDKGYATSAHLKGSYFIWYDKLAKATADISVDDSLSTSTNVEWVTSGIAGEVEELNKLKDAETTTDLDTATDNNKIYIFNTGATNAPFNYGFLHVMTEEGTTNTKQIAIYRGGTDAGTVAIRSRSAAGSWGSWEELAKKSDITTNLGTPSSNIRGYLRRVISNHSNISIGTSGYVDIDTYSDLGLNSSTDYIISMNLRGFSNFTTKNITLAKGSNGTTIYILAPSGTTLGSFSVEYFVWCGYVNTSI